MSLYGEEGSIIRGLLSAKIDQILLRYDDEEEIFVSRFVSLGELARNISPTRDEEEEKDLNFLYMIVVAIHSLWYSMYSRMAGIRAEATTDAETLDKMSKDIEYINNTTTEICKTFLEDLKLAMTDRGDKKIAIRAYENVYNAMVKDVLNKFAR